MHAQQNPTKEQRAQTKRTQSALSRPHPRLAEGDDGHETLLDARVQLHAQNRTEGRQLQLHNRHAAEPNKTQQEATGGANSSEIMQTGSIKHNNRHATAATAVSLSLCVCVYLNRLSGSSALASLCSGDLLESDDQGSCRVQQEDRCADRYCDKGLSIPTIARQQP